MDQPTDNPTTPDKGLRERVQAQVVELITQGLEEGTISEDRARNIARLVLERLPEGVSNEELMQILPKLDDDFAELTEVVLPIVSEYEEKLRQAVESKVLDLVRARKFKEALDLTRQGIDMSRNLSE